VIQFLLQCSAEHVALADCTNKKIVVKAALIFDFCVTLTKDFMFLQNGFATICLQSKMPRNQTRYF